MTVIAIFKQTLDTPYTSKVLCFLNTVVRNCKYPVENIRVLTVNVKITLNY